MSTRVWIDSDEWYPVYTISTEDDGLPCDAVLNIDETTLARWQAAHHAFQQAQHEINEAVDKRTRKPAYYAEDGRLDQPDDRPTA